MPDTAMSAAMTPEIEGHVEEACVGWGLAHGVMVLAIAGAFWLGLGIATAATVTTEVGWLVFAGATALQIGVSAAWLWTAPAIESDGCFSSSEMPCA